MFGTTVTMLTSRTLRHWADFYYFSLPNLRAKGHVDRLQGWYMTAGANRLRWQELLPASECHCAPSDLLDAISCIILN